jgi:phosphate transport system substrate-binding protein
MARQAFTMRSLCPACSALPVVAVAAALLLGAGVTAARAEVLRGGGTGSASEFVKRLGAAFATHEAGITVEVVASLGSSGAIAAVIDGALDFAVSARPLTAAEGAKSLSAVALARSPFGLASSYPQPGNISSSQVASFMRNPLSAWPDGTPLRIILRQKGEADSVTLINAYPDMAATMEQLRLRREIPIVATDQDNLQAAEAIPGSLIGLTLTQLLTEHSSLHFLTIDGVEPTLENFERGAYPIGKDYIMVFPAFKKPVLERFVAFVRSPEGALLLRETGNLPVQP